MKDPEEVDDEGKRMPIRSEGFRKRSHKFWEEKRRKSPTWPRKLAYRKKRSEDFLQFRAGWTDFACSADERVFSNIKGPKILVYFLCIIVGLGGFGIWLSILKSYPASSVIETVITYSLAIISSAAVDSITSSMKERRMKVPKVIDINSSEDVEDSKTVKVEINVVYLILTLFILSAVTAYLTIRTIESLSIILTFVAIILSWYLWLYSSAENYIEYDENENPYNVLGGSLDNQLLDGTGIGMVIKR